MGGVADYSGSLVLQMPIRGTTRVSLSAVRDDRLRFTSRGHGAWSAPLEPFRVLLDPAADETSARGFLQERGAPPWAFYLLGCLWVFCRAKGWRPPSGLSFDVQSRVPEGMGVASSAALEVATLRALGRLTGARFEGTELARLGQHAENRIVGAPCGLMDQLAAGHGRAGSLLPILCQTGYSPQAAPAAAGGCRCWLGQRREACGCGFALRDGAYGDFHGETNLRREDEAGVAACGGDCAVVLS